MKKKVSKYKAYESMVKQKLKEGKGWAVDNPFKSSESEAPDLMGKTLIGGREEFVIMRKGIDEQGEYMEMQIGQNPPTRLRRPEGEEKDED